MMRTVTDYSETDQTRWLSVVDTDRGESPFGWSDPALPTTERHTGTGALADPRFWIGLLIILAAVGAAWVLHPRRSSADLRAWREILASGARTSPRPPRGRRTPSAWRSRGSSPG